MKQGKNTDLIKIMAMAQELESDGRTHINHGYHLVDRDNHIILMTPDNRRAVFAFDAKEGFESIILSAEALVNMEYSTAVFRRVAFIGLLGMVLCVVGFFKSSGFLVALGVLSLISSVLIFAVGLYGD